MTMMTTMKKNSQDHPNTHLNPHNETNHNNHNAQATPNPLTQSP